MKVFLFLFLFKSLETVHFVRLLIVDIRPKNVKPTRSQPARRTQPKIPSPDRNSDPNDGNDKQLIVEETILVDARGNIIG